MKSSDKKTIWLRFTYVPLNNYGVNFISEYYLRKSREKVSVIVSTTIVGHIPPPATIWKCLR